MRPNDEFLDDYYEKYERENKETALVDDLEGKTITAIEIYGDDIALRFECSDGSIYYMFHDQNCCERVRIEDVCGKLDFLIGTPILMAEEVSGESGYDEEGLEHYTWTFYKFATRKGYVDIRWLGEGNGYYSESVAFVRIKGTMNVVDR